MSTFHLTIRTPDKDVYSGEVSVLTMTSDLGRMQILPHHASITTTLSFSPLRIEEAVREESFVARNGMFLFDNRKNEALLLALSCEEISEIDHKTALEYLQFLKDQLASGQSLNEFEVLFLEGEKFAVEKQVKMTNN